MQHLKAATLLYTLFPVEGDKYPFIRLTSLVYLCVCVYIYLCVYLCVYMCVFVCVIK